jgi:hypothetical protein
MYSYKMTFVLCSNNVVNSSKTAPGHTSICENGADKVCCPMCQLFSDSRIQEHLMQFAGSYLREGLTSIVDLSTACVDCLEQLINLIIAHFLAQVREDVSKLSNTNESAHILVENLEAATVLFWLTGLTESTWSVQDFRECLEVNCVVLLLAS